MPNQQRQSQQLWRCWLGGRKGIRPVKTEWWGAGVVVCLERDADLHMAQLMPLLLTVSCFSKIQIVFTFLVLAHPGSPGKRAVKRLCVCWIHYAFLQLSMLVWWWTCDFSNQLIITQMLMYGWCHWTDRSSLRKSTCEKTRSTEDCVREREARTAVMRQIADHKHVADVRRLTQEELLAEAKITEKINLRSLGLWSYS